MLRFFSSFWENFKEYIVLAALIIASLIILSLNNNQSVKRFRAVAFGSFAAVTSVVSDVVNFPSIKSENAALRERNAGLMLEINRLREYGITNKQLKGMLAVKDTAKLPLIPASVVSRSLSISQGTITINAGSSLGIKPGMPVISDMGLIGVIYSTSSNFSIARILKNRDLKLTVKDERSRVDGIMKWNGEDLVIIDVPKTYDIEPGDRIVTSDLSSIVSIPVPIGIVKGLNKVETGIFNEVVVKPFTDFSKVDYVFVIGIVDNKEKDDLELNFFNRK